METSRIFIGNIDVDLVKVNTVVVGTGAAGYNAAVTLKKSGIEDVCIVTEGVNTGTSRNTGSDKQTYYKMNLCAGDNDSPHAMAEELFAGKSVDGDIALAEAANSVRSFLNLCELGVDFPVNRYGEYVGYKTDHDTRARATSVGPLTSKKMTECLEKEANRCGVEVIDKCLVVDILKKDDRVVGLLCLNTEKAGEESTRFTLINAGNVILATGGPAGIYFDTVYPCGHFGSSGVAFRAGVAGQNLTEWQYGLASINPRWNVSGTYMQVLPRFVSVDENGQEYEFLLEYYGTPEKALSNVFRKGYEWPFDSRKALNGSSVIDLLVYREKMLKNRRVFLDYRTNPFSLDEIPFEKLDQEAYDYLDKSGALFGTPLERLEHMNMPAVELYMNKGVDLHKEMLEISLCAQHNNGGIAVNLWWKTDIDGLFAVGECAGTHGVYRPGGSALNSGQVGSYRAAKYISKKGLNNIDDGEFIKISEELVNYHNCLCNGMLQDNDTATSMLIKTQKEMTSVAAAIRVSDKLDEFSDTLKNRIVCFDKVVTVDNPKKLRLAYRLRDILYSQYMYVNSMIDFKNNTQVSRGSALYSSKCGECAQNLENVFKFVPDDCKLDALVQNVRMSNDLKIQCIWRAVRELPEGGGFFENVWREYRDNQNIY